MASTPARDPAKSSMGPASANKECLKPCSCALRFLRAAQEYLQGAAMRATTAAGPLRDFYATLLAKGRRPTMARLTLAWKSTAITLIVWKRGVNFDTKRLKLGDGFRTS